MPSLDDGDIGSEFGTWLEVQTALNWHFFSALNWLGDMVCNGFSVVCAVGILYLSIT